MSEEKQDAPKLSLLDQLKLQRAQFAQQKELAQTNLNQLVGAVFACDEMIKRHVEDAKKELPLEPQGDSQDGQADEQKQEQTA